MLKAFLFLFMISAVTWADIQTEEAKVLLQFRHRMDFFLDISEHTLLKQKNCLDKHNIESLQGDEIQDTDPECYQVIGDLFQKSVSVFKEIRVRKALDSAEMGYFLGLHYNQLGAIPQKAILNQNIDFQVSVDSEIDANDIQTQQESLGDPEVKNAVQLFAMFMKKNCNDFVTLVNQRKGFIDFGKVPFCQSIFQNRVKDILAEPQGDYALQSYARYLKSHYQSTFRKKNKERFMALISSRPYLSFVRGPKNFRKDLKPAIHYSFHSVDRLQKRRQAEAKEMGIDQMVDYNDIAALPKEKLGQVIEVLKADLLKNKFTEVFSYYSSIYNKELYHSLRARAEFDEALWTGLSVGAQVGAMALCAFPPTWLVSGVARLSAPLLSFLRVSHFSLTRFQQSLLCLVPPITPITIFTTIDSYQNFEKVHDLFFAQAGGAALFAEYKGLNEADQELFLNVLFLPFEGVATLQLLKAIKPLGQATISRILEFKKAQP